MSEQKHTPEPWPTYDGITHANLASITRDYPAYVRIHRDNYERAREAINALAGIENSEAFVKRAADLERLVKLYQVRGDLQKQYDYMINVAENNPEHLGLLRGFEAAQPTGKELLRVNDEIAELTERLGL